MNRRERHQARQQKQLDRIQQISFKIYQRRSARGYKGSSEQDWKKAERIAKSPIRRGQFHINQWLARRWRSSINWYESTTLEHALDTLNADLKKIAVFDLLSLLANVAIITSLGAFLTGGERQRHDEQVYAAWQVITAAYGQPGNGGRKRALEFLNSTPGSPGRRRWFGKPWARESLQGVDVAKANLAEVRLPNADLRGANLQDADLGYANLQDADLEYANLQDADLEYANLQSSELSFVNLQNAKLLSANLQGSNLRSADLRGSELYEVNLQASNLSGAKLQGSGLRGADLQGSNLKGAKLQDADLNSTSFQRSNLILANFQGSDLSSANFQDAELIAANFQDAYLSFANFQDAQLHEANFQGATLSSTNFHDADLSYANLQGSILIAVDMRRVKLRPDQLTETIICNLALPADITTVSSDRDCATAAQSLIDWSERVKWELRDDRVPVSQNSSSLTLERAQRIVEAFQEVTWEPLSAAEDLPVNP